MEYLLGIGNRLHIFQRWQIEWHRAVWTAGRPPDRGLVEQEPRFRHANRHRVNDERRETADRFGDLLTTLLRWLALCVSVNDEHVAWMEIPRCFDSVPELARRLWKLP